MLVEGDWAYVVLSHEGLVVVDVSDRTNPRVDRMIANADIRGESWLAKRGEFIYHGTFRNFIYDLRDNSVRQWLGEHEQLFGIAIRDNLAFAAKYNAGLAVYDLQDPLSPIEVATVPTPQNYVNDIVIQDDIAYLGGSHDASVSMIDISDPAAPRFIAAVDSPGVVLNVAVAGGFAWTGHNGSPNARIPLPIRITDTLSENPGRMIAFIESPTIEGHYTLTANESGQVVERAGAISYSNRSSLFSRSDDSGEVDDDGLSKAIIVAGGGPYPGNNLWDATVLVARKAYAALITQGYRRENIRFLSPESLDVDFDGRLNDVDGLASLQRLEESILRWVTDPVAPAHELVLYIADHGGDKQFRLNSEQTLSAEQLDGWLDTLQQTLPGKVIVIYEACQSGTFVDALTPPPGKERVVLTSAGNEPAWFTNQGLLSFSYQFWGIVQAGGKVSRAYRVASELMSGFQTAQVDANNNGVPGEPGDSLKGLTIGRGFVSAADNPTIGAVTEPFETHIHTAEVAASGIIDATGVSRVWAVVRPPGYVSGPADRPVLDVPTIELLDDDGDNTWVGEYDGFRQAGDYNVAFFAINDNGGLSTPTETNTNRTIVTRIGTDPNQAPQLTLIGRPGVAMLAGEEYEDAGVVAIDVEDGSLSGTVVMTSNLNPSVPGRYEVTYTVADSDGLQATVSRSIVVASDTEPATAFDFDRDGIPDDIDFDDDNDLVPDTLDRFPLNAMERDDTDGDGIGDVEDTDDDGDGIADEVDHFPTDATLTIRGSVRNISTRGVVGAGDDVMIAGLIIEGQVARTVVIRARGPSLADFGVPGVLADPRLQLFDASGNLMDENGDWALHASMGNLPVELTPTNPLESVITVTLDPGPYTAIVRGEGGGSGVGIVEVFDITED